MTPLFTQALYCFVGVFETQYPAYSFVNKGCLKINGRLVTFIIYRFFFQGAPCEALLILEPLCWGEVFCVGTERLSAMFCLCFCLVSWCHRNLCDMLFSTKFPLCHCPANLRVRVSISIPLTGKAFISWSYSESLRYYCCFHYGKSQLYYILFWIIYVCIKNKSTCKLVGTLFWSVVIWIFSALFFFIILLFLILWNCGI